MFKLQILQPRVKIKVYNNTKNILNCHKWIKQNFVLAKKAHEKWKWNGKNSGSLISNFKTTKIIQRKF